MKPSSLKYLVGQGVRNIWTNRIMSFASFCVLLVSILLVGFTVLVTMNINRFVNGIENKNEVIIFLVDDVSDETIENMGNLLRNTQNVSSVVFYSKEEAFEDMKKNYEKPLVEILDLEGQDIIMFSKVFTEDDGDIDWDDDVFGDLF